MSPRRARRPALLRLPAAALALGLAALLAAPSRAAPNASQTHLLIMHTPKTGGTEFRQLVFARARALGLSRQTHYGREFKNGAGNFNASRPAAVVMGHGVNFKLLQPVAPGRRLRYVTMTRSPYSWFLSLYLHFHRDGSEPYSAQFLNNSVRACPGLLRDTKNTGCGGSQLYAWHAGGVDAVPPDRCRAFVALFTRPHHLLLVNERYDDSIWLLLELLGWGPPPPVGRANRRDDKAYQKNFTLDEARDIDRLLATTCMPDIWAAARERFDRVHAEARAFTRENPGVALAALAGRLWPPLEGAST